MSLILTPTFLVGQLGMRRRVAGSRGKHEPLVAHLRRATQFRQGAVQQMNRRCTETDNNKRSKDIFTTIIMLKHCYHSHRHHNTFCLPVPLQCYSLFNIYAIVKNTEIINLELISKLESEADDGGQGRGGLVSCSDEMSFELRI